VRDGDVVLDLATGVGAMAAQLKKYFPKITLFGVDLRESQLKTAKARHPIAHYAQANGARLPFRDATFDRVHCSWLLEHIPTPPGPVAILREVRRVLKPDGLCHFIEVDNSTWRTVPEIPDITAVMNALNDAQLIGGGDPFVGQKLPALFKDAGFTRVTTRQSKLYGTPEEPVFMQAFIDEFAEIFESLDEALPPEEAKRAQRAAAALRNLIKVPNSELHYSGVIARAQP
jgi:ubiquinone/menaquinone biosynthesis C-methylase UbiE